MHLTSDVMIKRRAWNQPTPLASMCSSIERDSHLPTLLDTPGIWMSGAVSARTRGILSTGVMVSLLPVAVT